MQDSDLYGEHSSLGWRRRRPPSSVRRRWLARALLIGGVLASWTGTALAQEAPSVLAHFTTGIENREPIDHISFVKNDARKVYFFTDLRGLGGQTIQHRWRYGGKVVAEVAFEVQGPRWRVWSSKDLLPDWIGDWTVEIVTAGGEVIAAESFTYSAPGA